MKSADGTNRRAGGMLAVHAQAAHEFVVFGHDDGVFMLRLHRLRCHLIVVGQLVLLRARTFTLFATDAHGCVVQQGLTHGNRSSLLPSWPSVAEKLSKSAQDD
jgi:hypothetical protein